MTLLFIYFHECVSDDLTMVTECRLYERDWSGVGKRESLLGTVCVCVCVCVGGWVSVDGLCFDEMLAATRRW